MKRWIGLVCILALLVIVAVPPVGADVTDLYIEITDYERNPAQGSTFDVSFTVHVPPEISMPSSSASKPCFLYYSTFYFVGDEIKYPAEGYWWGDYEGSVFYNSSATNYTVKVKMLTGSNAPVNQEFYLGIYWKIPLEGEWENTGDNITFTIYGDDNTYARSVVETTQYTDYTRYTLFAGAVSDIYVRSDEKGYLYVRSLKSGLTVSAAPGLEIPLWAIIAGVVILIVVAVVIILAKRRKGEEFPPVPEFAPPPPPEAPPAPPEAPPPTGGTTATS